MGKRWEQSDFEKRTMGGARPEGYEPGTPDDTEIMTYKAYAEEVLTDPFSDAPALVMGMTVRVRKAMHEIGCQVTCMDISEDAVSYLRDAIPANYVANETVMNADWMTLPEALPGPVDVIAGDGVFSNILSVEEHLLLLERLRRTLRPTGAIVSRAFCIPDGFDFDQFEPATILAAYRDGKLTDGEFSHGYRIFGFWNEAFDAESRILDNKIIFDCVDQWKADGKLSDAEYAVVRQNYFGGLTFMPTEAMWEDMLDQTGFDFEKRYHTGRLWYQYGPIYKATPRA